MSNIVKDIVQTNQGSVTTEPLRDNTDIGGAVSNLVLGLADMGLKAYTDYQKQGGSAGNTKDYTLAYEAYQNVYKWNKATGATTEQLKEKMDSVNSSLAYMYTPSELASVAKQSGLDTFTTSIEEADKEFAARQKAEEDAYRDAYVMTGGDPNAPDAIEKGKAVVVESIMSQTVLDTANSMQNAEDKEAFLQSSEAILSKALHNSFQEFLTTTGRPLDTAAVAEFKSAWVQQQMSKGLPLSFAENLAERNLGIYRVVTERFAGDQKKISEEINTLNAISKGQALQNYYNTLYPMKDTEGNTTYMRGSEIAVLEEQSPKLIERLILNNLQTLPSLISGSMPVDDKAASKLSSPGAYSLFFRELPETQQKQMTDNVRNAVTKKIGEAMTRASGEVLANNRVENSAMDGFVNMSKAYTAEQASKDDTWNDTINEVIGVQAESNNKLYNGNGVVLMDPSTGELRYYTVEFNSDGTFDNIEDSSKDGIVIPWGDYDSVTFRDSSAASTYAFLKEARKNGASLEDVANRWNKAQIMNSTGMRKYADVLRQTQGGAQMDTVVGLSTGMSTQEAEAIIEEILRMPTQGSWREGIRAIPSMIGGAIKDVGTGTVRAAGGLTAGLYSVAEAPGTLLGAGVAKLKAGDAVERRIESEKRLAVEQALVGEKDSFKEDNRELLVNTFKHVEDLEGSIPHAYLDIGGKITAGRGILADNEEDFIELPWKTADGREATTEEKREEYKRISQVKQELQKDLDTGNKQAFNVRAGEYADMAGLQLHLEDVDSTALTLEHLKKDIKIVEEKLRKLPKPVNFKELPPELRTLLLDYQYNMGYIPMDLIKEGERKGEYKWPRFTEAFYNKDIEGMSEQSSRSKLPQRNKVTKKLFKEMKSKNYQGWK